MTNTNNNDDNIGPVKLERGRGKLPCGCAVNDSLPPTLHGWHCFGQEGKDVTITAPIYVCTRHGYEQHGLTFPASMRVTWCPESGRWEIGHFGWQVNLHSTLAHLANPRTGKVIKVGTYHPTKDVYPEAINPPRENRPSKASVAEWGRFTEWANDNANRILGPLTPAMIRNITAERKAVSQRRLDEAKERVGAIKKSLSDDLALLNGLAQQAKLTKKKAGSTSAKTRKSSNTTRKSDTKNN